MAEVLVSASTGAMGSLLRKLGAMLTDEYKLLKNVREDIKFLKDELEVMCAFLLKMSDVEEPEEPTKLRVTAVREMSYKIEDNIDKFMVLVEHESSSSEAHGLTKLMDKCKNLLPDIKTRRKIAKEVKDIKKEIKDVSDRFLRYKIDESSTSVPAKDRVDPRLRAVYKDAAELVGIDGPKDELVRWLNEEEGQSLKFVSIVGSGGLGKTTLANQIRLNLGATFDCGAFVSISRKPDMKAILRSILSQITKKDHAYSNLDDIRLIMDKIREFLQDSRYFIIIDDIWELGTWETLKCAFVKNTLGSRIIITTRIVDVAKSCSPSSDDLVYEMKPLSEADSKKLFFKRIFGCEESCPDSLKEAANDILKKCRGLPLAINAISSLLATTRETKEEWDQVRHSIRSSKAKSDIIETMNYILSLSYFDLPHHLRSCLLYLALFPEDEMIERQRLVRRWISEGFIHGENGQDLMELGEEYFHQLVNRSLIQPDDIGYDGKAEYCRVHDTILDFLIDKSSQENMCTVLKKQCKPNGIVRRLSLKGNEDEEIVEQLDLSHARSISAFGDIKLLPSLGRSKCLRVLDLQHCDQLKNHHIKDIERRLYQLRYLDISFTEITELPRQIGELLYLETLVTSFRLSELPESTTRLLGLTRLFVHPCCKLPDGLRNLINLQELDCVDALQWKLVEELGKLTNLRKLRIRLDTDGIEGDKLEQSKEKLVSSLCKLDKCGLRSLSIDYKVGKKDGEEPFLPALGCIQEVCVYGKDISRISRWLASLPNLHTLSFIGRKIEQQDIEMVGLIPNLIELSLCFREDAGRLIISREGFQQLQSFNLSGTGVGLLMFEPGAMPRLNELGLYNFNERSAAVDFDFGIQRLSSLARLTVSIYCIGWTAAEVKASEDAFKSMAEANPSRPILKMTRLNPQYMLREEQIDMAGSGTTNKFVLLYW
ncbi:disease resistance protein RGA5-like isoform X1 [Hordeum vulgare subsp. vulgare]|uniref:disease resistance protein RGA5-like isoform X1 n=1 Tax=Hordeum vulgare subsp. vulgare TaxID=112509 RepID=UPI001D1A358B|nr:disease resistance protein RGA5-like isoform X1 [Hordeum vulgare subsp. vulgare]